MAKRAFKSAALHLVVLHKEEMNTRGTPEHAKALSALTAGRQLWREQSRRKCPECGHPIHE